MAQQIYGGQKKMTGACDEKTKNPMHEAREALKKHPRCNAYARTTGAFCKNPAMKNGRCRMHGGKSTGRPIVYGIYTQEQKRKNAEIKQILRAFNELLDEF